MRRAEKALDQYFPAIPVSLSGTVEERPGRRVSLGAEPMVCNTCRGSAIAFASNAYHPQPPQEYHHDQHTTDLTANPTTASLEEELAVLHTEVDALWRARQDVETRAARLVAVKVRELSLTPP